MQIQRQDKPQPQGQIAATPAYDDQLFTSTQFRRPTFLMCAPDWYEKRDSDSSVSETHQTQDPQSALQQWNSLYQGLKKLGDVRLIRGVKDSPDMTFIAHGAVLNYGVAALSFFSHLQRTVEEDHLEAWLNQAGFIVWKSEGIFLEGEGDVLFEPDGRRLWAAHGARTSRQSHARLSNVWHIDVTSLQLVDPRFYHLDLCFAPLSRGHILYYPGAFDRRSIEKIEEAYRPQNRITVSEEEAVQLACNVINVGDDILMHPAGAVANRIRNAGYRVSEFPLGEFVHRGGAAKSLALRLSDLVITHQPVVVALE